MYRGDQSARVAASEGRWVAEGLHKAREADVLKAGDVPPVVVIAILCVWVAISVPLTVLAGFRPRLASTFDSYLAKRVLGMSP
jgi:uncharacterized membrane protein YphA (DoxX/SURF4 family)